MAILEDGDTPPSQRIDAVLSAIFYGESLEFAGDVLINEFAQARYPEKMGLKNLFETFYQSCGTSYRIDDSIRLLEKYRENESTRSDEIGATIRALTEYREIFRDS